jgi:hypothetical protein
MTVERMLALAVLICSIGLLLRLGPAAIRSWLIYAGTGQRRQEDATGRAPVQPVGVADRARLLDPLGYRPLGVTRLVLPVGERFAWILAAASAESHAVLVDAPAIGGLTGIYSAWLADRDQIHDAEGPREPCSRHDPWGQARPARESQADGQREPRRRR